MRKDKFFNCNQKGHLAKIYPFPRKYSKRVIIGTEDSSVDPWFHGVFVMNATASDNQVSSKGPTHKVDIIIGGVPTRGLLNHGAQVILARNELLPMIREKTSRNSIIFLLTYSLLE